MRIHQKPRSFSCRVLFDLAATNPLSLRLDDDHRRLVHDMLCTGNQRSSRKGMQQGRDVIKLPDACHDTPRTMLTLSAHPTHQRL